ncbi:MAG: 16S rRNA (adenine(1518)-N(6)/adenine(1519)-N(6))-dimethyltransferase RsmA [Clostridiales bacterium]|nr:16S rRNA (adenine(1518)-N(6)/adenine(1519)-N(6))-dimethyltransferase RsmA [Clostridiales bacterium]
MEKSVKEILAENNFGFKKKFGQNFITDKNLLESIVSLAEVGASDTVIEIGCGAGTLTRALAGVAEKVIAFEIDTALQPVLAQTLAGCDNVEVVFRDFLKVDLKQIEKDLASYKVVANLPYYITTPLIMKLVEQSEKCESLTVMVQEEVAERLCAKQNTPEYGAITASVALRAEAKLVKKVPRTAFTPRPNVDSAVVNLKIEDRRLPVKDSEIYKKVVRAAFLSRRKTLVNNLMVAFELKRAETEEVLNRVGIDLKARGETLSPTDFAALSNALTK